LESTFHWLSEDTVKFEVDVWFYEKFAKILQLTHAKWTFAAWCGVRATIMVAN